MSGRKIIDSTQKNEAMAVRRQRVNAMNPSAGFSILVRLHADSWRQNPVKLWIVVTD
jgi:hypothetical protein